VGAVSFEVLGQYICVVPYLSKVNGLPAFLEEEQSIKSLEQHCRRLMDLRMSATANAEIDVLLTVQRTAWPFFVNFSIRSQMAHEV
jgi:hypothetical protein